MTIEKNTPPAEMQALSFESALRELETIVRRMESGEGELEQSIRDYERGMALKAHCEARLADAKMKVEKVVEGQAGLSTVPFEGGI